MTTMLRSSKYIRCLNALTRRIIVANDNSTVVRTSLKLQAKCANSYLTKSYATIPAIKRTHDNAHNYDSTFAKLDDNIQRYGRLLKTEVEDVLSQVREAGYISSLDALLLIRCCGNLLSDILPQERTKLANKIWSTLTLLRIPMDVSHFNALLRVYIENDYEFSPIELLTTMKNRGVEPNRITYQRLMMHHCKKGDIEGAMKILEFMRKKEIPLSEGIFSALIIGHSEAGDLESAKNVMNIMAEADVVPSSATYTALLSAYAKRGDMASIKTTLEAFLTKNMFLQDNDYFKVIHTLAANDHTEKIDEILAMMPKGPNYNIDATHAILKILDVGNVDAALKILPTMRKRRRFDDDKNAENENGIFLIKKLVIANYPSEQVVNACERLYNENQNKKSFLIALHRSLTENNNELSYALMDAWKRNGGELREHYFWPLLTASGKASNYQGIVDVLRTMITKFDVTPSFETLKEYILPYTVGKWENVVNSLKELRLPHEKIISSIACRMLTDNKIRKTATFMLNYPAKHDGENFYQPLADAVRRTGDTRSFAVIVRLLGGDDKKTEESNVENNSKIIAVADNTMRRLLKMTPSINSSIIETALEHMVETGLSLSPETGNAIREYLADNMNPLTDERIEKLTSGSLKPVPVFELAAFIDSDNIRESFQEDSRAIFWGKRRTLAAAIEKDDIEAVTRITKELDEENFNYSPGLYAQIIDVYCSAEDIETAEIWLKRYKSHYPESPMDLQKTTKFARLFIKNDRFDDAIQFIKDAPRLHNPENFNKNLKILCKSLLDLAAETGNVEKTNEFFDVLIRNKYIAVDNFILGPLIKVHLIRGDKDGAFKAFEKICEIHQCTPLKSELSKIFIDSEDAESLQRLTDLSTQVHGENNSLVDLALAFIECGRLHQARKILETPGLKIREKKLRTISDRYATNALSDFLQQWTTLTKGLTIMDRQEYYDILMEAYSTRDNWKGAMDLWMCIQEEDVQPSGKFLKYLADVLKKNNQPVPFVSDTITADDSADLPARSIQMVDFYKALNNHDLTEAESLLKCISTEHREYTSAVSSLILAYMNDKNDLDKAANLAEETLLKTRRIVRAKALKAIWKGFVDSKNLERLQRHGEILDELNKTHVKSRWRFNKFLSRAELNKFGAAKFLKDFEEKLSAPNCDKESFVNERLHFATLIDELNKDPSIVEQFRTLAENLSKENVLLPMNLIWCYYFVQEKTEADEIWSKHLAHTEHILFKYIVGVSKEKNDVRLAERLFEKICSNSAVPDRPKVFAFANLIDLYAINGQVEQALELVENHTPSIIEAWCRSFQRSVDGLKKSAELSGKSLNLDINEIRRRNNVDEHSG